MELVEELREDFLMCTICFEEYREPKQLPCLHTFCRQCLAKYIVSKVTETGAEWFPCPFCRKPTQPTQGGEATTWADSFPSNFLLSQLSCKLQGKADADHGNTHDITADRAVTPKTMCSKHPQFHLVAYCKRQRLPVCEECSVRMHFDCIRNHVKERDSLPMAEERRSECQESLGVLQIRLESVKDTLSTREADLATRKEKLAHETEAAMFEVRNRVERFLLEHRQELTNKLQNFFAEEKNRLSAVRDRAAELAKFSQKASKKLSGADDGSTGVKELLKLDKLHDQLKSQEQLIEKLRKDCFLRDLYFYPNSGVEKVLKSLTPGTLTLERKSQASGGAKPRVQRYISEPSDSVSYFTELEHQGSSQSSRSSSDSQSLAECLDSVPQLKRQPRKGRTLSPPGAAASALTSSPSMAEGATSADWDSHAEYRRRSEGPSILSASRKTPTVPDFGAVLIEESRVKKNVRRRARPLSEGSILSPFRRRGVSSETAVDGSAESEQNMLVLEREPQVLTQRESHSVTGSRSATGTQQASADDLSSFDSNVTLVRQTIERNTDRDQASFDDETSDQSSRKILCVRHFTASHESDIKNQPGLVGISAVSRDRVAVSDRWNKVIKLLDIGGRVLDVLAISEDAEPWDLVLRKQGVLAVTYPKEQKIRIVDVADSGSRLYYRSYFMTRDGYASLATCDVNSLVASVCPPFGSPKIHVIDYLGTVLRSVDCSNVAYPRCVDIGGGDEICVSDWTHHNVKIFSRDGTAVKHTYSGVPGDPDAQLKAPMGLAWDRRNHMFIVDGKTAKLHAVCMQSGQCSAIFTLPQGSGAEVKLVAFVEASPELCRSERALVVTTTSGSVQVYDLCSAY